VNSGLTDARQSYADTLVKDIVASDASRRAAARLSACVAELVEATAAPLPAEDPERATRHCVELRGRPIGLDDGSARYVAALSPSPSLSWELAFHEFEGAIYLPDPRRVPFVHGVFAFGAAPHERDRVLAQLATRVERFELSMA
jgi:hypothetical protein